MKTLYEILGTIIEEISSKTPGGDPEEISEEFFKGNLVRICKEILELFLDNKQERFLRVPHFRTNA